MQDAEEAASGASLATPSGPATPLGARRGDKGTDGRLRSRMLTDSQLNAHLASQYDLVDLTRVKELLLTLQQEAATSAGRGAVTAAKQMAAAAIAAAMGSAGASGGPVQLAPMLEAVVSRLQSDLRATQLALSEAERRAGEHGGGEAGGSTGAPVPRAPRARRSNSGPPALDESGNGIKVDQAISQVRGHTHARQYVLCEYGCAASTGGC